MAFQPTSASPISRETVDIVKKKVGAPSGPPPSASRQFNMPKSVSNTPYSPPTFKYDSKYNDHDDDDGDNSDDDSDDSPPRNNKQLNSHTTNNNNHNSIYNKNRNHIEDEKDEEKSEVDEDDFIRSNINSNSKPPLSPQRSRASNGNNNNTNNLDKYNNRNTNTNNNNIHRNNESKSSSSSYNNNNHNSNNNDSDSNSSTSPRDDQYNNNNNNNKPNKPLQRSINKASTAENNTDSKNSNSNGNNRKNNENISPAKQLNTNNSNNNNNAIHNNPTSSSSSSSSSPMKLKIFNFYSFLKTAKNRKLKSFLLSPIESNILIRCYIERDRNGTNVLGPVYTLCADLEDGSGQELMVCKKVMLSRTAHYVFSILSSDLNKKREERSKLYLGKLRAGQVHGEYILCDQGLQARHTTATSSSSSSSSMRRSDSTILNASTNRMSIDGNNSFDNSDVASGIIKPRKPPGETNTSAMNYNRNSLSKSSNNNSQHDLSGMEDDEDSDVYTNNNNRANSISSAVAVVTDDKIESASIKFNCLFRPAPSGMRGLEIGIPHPTEPFNLHSSLSLTDKFHRICNKDKQNVLLSDECMILHERKTKYDPLSSCLVDYSGRANIASVKNFQLVVSTPLRHGEDEFIDKAENFVLQLGKTTEDCFNMDVKYPLSPFQAFAISIARFDAKLSWKDF